MLEGDFMKAVVLEKTCAPSELEVKEVPIPEVKPEWLLVKVMGFGINRAEVILRDCEADEDYMDLPVIPGIECVGKVIDPSNTRFKKGDKVVGLMGGMGRSFDGSYAEYVLLPSKNTFKIPNETFDKLDIEEIIAIPESYFTAYGSIESLQIENSDTVLIRGATSALGLTAMQLIASTGATIIATSRDESRFSKLKSNGADCTIVDGGKIEDTVKEICPDGVSKVLELIGPKTLKDSLNCLREYGICCNTGVLGGVEYMSEFDPIKIIPNNRYLTSFFSNYPTQEIIDNLFNFILENDIHPNISNVFTDLEQISDAHELMESNEAQGKIIFRLVK